jgi:hypothetical protein
MAHSSDQSWNHNFDAARAEYHDRYANARRDTIRAEIAGFRRTLQTHSDNPVASGAIVGLADLLQEA